MSDPVIKGVKRSPSRPASRHSSNTSSARDRATASKTAAPQPLKKRPAAEKAPARKATKTGAKTPARPAAKNLSTKAAKSAPAKKSAPAPSKPKAAPAKSKPQAQEAKSAGKRPTTAAKATAKAPQHPAAKPAPPRKSAAPAQPVRRQPTQDEAAALRAFERAHKEFVRGHFGEARQQFRALVEKHAGVSEVTARARTYLAIAESRLRSAPPLPRDADSLYDRGVIELNRGDYVAAQELFERALKREPEAAHIHYGLAATRSRLGSVETALESLRRALEIQPSLRVHAQHDPDLTALRNDSEFERLVFAPRF